LINGKVKKLIKGSKDLKWSLVSNEKLQRNTLA